MMLMPVCLYRWCILTTPASHAVLPQVPAVQSAVSFVAVQLPVGTVRVSLGAYSRFEDVHVFVTFLDEAFEDKRGTVTP